MSQFDPPNDPFSPYAAPQMPKEPQGPQGNPLLVPGILLIVLSSLWLLYGLVNIVVAVTTGPPAPPPNAAPEFLIGQKIGFYAAAVLLPVFGLVPLIGAICLVRLRNYGLAMAGVIAGLVPCCGPCVVLAIPVSIWALVVMLRPEVKAMFR